MWRLCRKISQEFIRAGDIQVRVRGVINAVMKPLKILIIVQSVERDYHE